MNETMNKMNQTIQLPEPLPEGFKVVLTDLAFTTVNQPRVFEGLRQRGVTDLTIRDCSRDTMHWIAESNVGWLGMSLLLEDEGGDSVVGFKQQTSEGVDPESLARAWLGEMDRQNPLNQRDE